MINCSFCFKNLEKYEESAQLINRGILGLEYLEKVMQANGGVLKGFVEKSTHMLALVEYFRKSLTFLFRFLFNKEEQIFDDITDNEHHKLIYFLSIAYKYYSEIMNKQKRTQETQFCLDTSKALYKKFKKCHQRTQKLMKPPSQQQQPGFSDFDSDASLSKVPQKGILKSNQTLPFKAKAGQNYQPQTTLQQQQSEQILQNQSSRNSKLTQNILNKNFPEQKIMPIDRQQPHMDDNFSHASFKTVNTNTTLGGGQSFVNKDNIIFQKYLNVGETRYKIVIVQIKEFNCVQLLLYNKPKNFLKKIIIGYTTLLEYAQKNKQEAFSDTNNLNNLFKDIGRKLYMENGELKLKDIESFETVEQFMKTTRLQNQQKVN